MMFIDNFVSKFETRIQLDENLIVKSRERYFLLSEAVKSTFPKKKEFFYAGVYLGMKEERTFVPGFNLLSMIAKTQANKTVVNKKTEWLFVCGRDVFKKGIVKTTGLWRKGKYTLVLNEFGECLGYGRILCNLVEKRSKQKTVVKNLLDIGHFLRREKA